MTMKLSGSQVGEVTKQQVNPEANNKNKQFMSVMSPVTASINDYSSDHHLSSKPQNTQQLQSMAI